MGKDRNKLEFDYKGRIFIEIREFEVPKSVGPKMKTTSNSKDVVIVREIISPEKSCSRYKKRSWYRIKYKFGRTYYK